MKKLFFLSFLFIGLSLSYFYYKNKNKSDDISFKNIKEVNDENFSEPKSKDLSQNEISQIEIQKKSKSEHENNQKSLTSKEEVLLEKPQEIQRPLAIIPQEDLDSFFNQVEEDSSYSISPSLFAYPKHMFNKNDYKNEIVHETTDLFFVENLQKPENSYEVIKKPSGELSIFLGSVAMTVKKKKIEEVRAYLSEKKRIYRFYPPSIFILPSSNAEEAFQIKKELEEEIRGLYKEVSIDMRSYFPKPM